MKYNIDNKEIKMLEKYTSESILTSKNIINETFIRKTIINSILTNKELRNLNKINVITNIVWPTNISEEVIETFMGNIIRSKNAWV